MSKTGKILWQDLTVQNATEIKDFYCEVIGWTATDVSQGDYNDFNILSKDGEVVDFPSQC